MLNAMGLLIKKIVPFQDEFKRLEVECNKTICLGLIEFIVPHRWCFNLWLSFSIVLSTMLGTCAPLVLKPNYCLVLK